jgi:hypothetical protein
MNRKLTQADFDGAYTCCDLSYLDDYSSSLDKSYYWFHSASKIMIMVSITLMTILLSW